MLIIRADEINSTDMIGVQEEIVALLKSRTTKSYTGDEIEAIASRILTLDEDWTDESVNDLTEVNSVTDIDQIIDLACRKYQDENRPDRGRAQINAQVSAYFNADVDLTPTEVEEALAELFAESSPKPEMFGNVAGNGEYDLTYEEMLDEVRACPADEAFSDLDAVAFAGNQGTEYTGRELLEIIERLNAAAPVATDRILTCGRVSTTYLCGRSYDDCRLTVDGRTWTGRVHPYNSCDGSKTSYQFIADSDEFDGDEDVTDLMK